MASNILRLSLLAPVRSDGDIQSVTQHGPDRCQSASQLRLLADCDHRVPFSASTLTSSSEIQIPWACHLGPRKLRS